MYLILATKYYSGVSTTECLVWLLAIIVPVVSLVLLFLAVPRVFFLFIRIGDYTTCVCQ